MNRVPIGCLVLLAAVAADGCHSNSKPAPGSVKASAANQRVYQVKGIVRQLEADGRTVVVRDEETPSYMAAMTMPFEVRDPNELRGLRTNDAITFRMVVTDQAG